jgi:hypothetical protein
MVSGVNVGVDTNVTFGAMPSDGTGPFVIAWQFGDGASAAGGNVVHAYRLAGTFAVHLVVSDAVGSQAFQNLSVTAANASADRQGTVVAREALALSLVGAGLAVAVIAATLIVLRRRRRHRPSTPIAAAAAGQERWRGEELEGHSDSRSARRNASRIWRR